MIFSKSVCLPNGRSFADEWHTYTVDWTTEYIAFELDGAEFFRIPKEKLDIMNDEISLVT